MHPYCAHNSCHNVTPILFFNNSLPLLVLCILPQNEKILNMRSFNFIAISAQIWSNFSTNARSREANFTWNNITCKNVLKWPICNEINKSALSRVLHETYLFHVARKLVSPYITKVSEKHPSNTLISERRTVASQFFLLFWHEPRPHAFMCNRVNFPPSLSGDITFDYLPKTTGNETVLSSNCSKSLEKIWMWERP